MRKIMIGVWILATMAFFSCGENNSATEGKVQITGKIENAPEGLVVLTQYTDSRPKVLDTLEVDSKGEFSYDLEVTSPTFYELNLYGQRAVKLALFKENVDVKYNFSDPASLQIEGSQDSKEMLKLEKLMEEYQLTVNALNEQYYEAMSKNDSEAIKRIQMEAMTLESQQAEKVKEMINSMGDSFASLAAIGLLNPKNDFPFIDELVSKLNENYPGTMSIMQMKQQLDEMRALSVGQVAPDFELPDPNGNMVKLSDLRGKYVLIDFWAAWCKPCRQENPNVVRLYNQYKDKGFEVFGVSLDRTKEDWVKAIADDQLTWTHVSDLKYFNSAAAELYKIEAIPATYMIDPDGKIIAKDLRGPSLENKLAELFD
ncbi:TlpA disulfide reductase family protein [Algoriphagus sp. AK58]|uniref:TlpA disulfide reductase family protein n=1 Tax=Algoriphagus sp. AK58 TaxID=1406877 RepID=UPI001650C8E6|nr:TlpA disulfide reductase family protein [Algoriphagus sp. AK58]MBC6366042.1 cytochrome C biogenesis protein [Algoriphagus sp. AK58]